MADKQFFQVVGNVGNPPAISKNRDDILEFSIARNDGYGDDAETEWWNIAIFIESKAHLAAFAKKNLHKGSKGVYVEGYGTIKDANNGKKFRDLTASRIGLVEFVGKDFAAEPEDEDGDDY